MGRVIAFIAFRQLWERKFLNGLAALGVTLGVLSLIFTNDLLAGLKRKFTDTVTRMSAHVTVYDRQLLRTPPMLAIYENGFVAARIAHQTPGDRQLRIQRPAEVVRSIQQLPGVVAAAGYVVGSAVLAFGPKEIPVDLRGIDPVRQDRVTPISEYLAQGNLRSFGAANDGIILGAGVASRLGAKVGDSVLVGSPLGERATLKVHGIFDSGITALDNVRTYVLLRTAQAILGKPDMVRRVDVKLDDPERAVEVTAQLERMLGYDAESWEEANSGVLTVWLQMKQSFNFVVGAILMVGGFSILAIQIMIVFQKTRDIALLRAVGFRKRDILAVVLLQGAVVAMIGAAIGNVVGHYMVVAMSHVRTPGAGGTIHYEYVPIYEDPRFYYYGTAFALVVGLVASFIPAWRGSRVEPVEVLRGQLG